MVFTVLNREDPEWFWIVRSDGQEGFIPSGFVYPADNVLQESAKAAQATATAAATTNSPAANNNHNIMSHQLIGSGNDGHLSVVVGNNHMNNNTNGSASQLGSPQPHSTQITQHQQEQQQQPQQPVTTTNSASTLGAADDLRYHGTELVMLYDYKAQAPDDLSVRRGDWIYADLNNQTVDGWLWAYAPKTRKYGFIPKAYARPPAMTSL